VIGVERTLKVSEIIGLPSTVVRGFSMSLRALALAAADRLHVSRSRTSKKGGQPANASIEAFSQDEAAG
jgi:hypothetical protein